MPTKTEEKKEVGWVESSILTMRDLFLANREHITKMLPRAFRVDDLLELGLTAMQENPKLAECHPASFLGALIKCRQMRLKPATPAGHAHLVPFMNSRKNRLEAQFIPGYRGLIDVATRDGDVVKIESRVVHAKDKFDYEYGTEPKITHVPAREAQPGEPTHYYAVAFHKDGSKQIDVMTVAEVERIRNRSQGYRFDKSNSPWTSDAEEMGKKTVVRRICKMLPAGEELQEAVSLQERGELGFPQDLAMLASPKETATPKGPEPIREPEEKKDIKKPIRIPDKLSFDEAKGEGFYEGYVDSANTERRGKYTVHLIKCGEMEFGTFNTEDMALAQSAAQYGLRVRIMFKKTAKGNNSIASIENLGDTNAPKA